MQQENFFLVNNTQPLNQTCYKYIKAHCVCCKAVGHRILNRETEFHGTLSVVSGLPILFQILL